jgi:hypothetical protein
VTDTDHAKAAEPLTALEWLRVTHADTLSGRRIEEAIAAERAAAVADLRARVEAVAEEMDGVARVTGGWINGSSFADSLRAAVTDTTGGK